MAKNALELAPAAPPPELEKTPPADLGNMVGGPAARPMPTLPAPSHAHTVAALRHFTIYLRAIEKLLRDPDLGRSSIKNELIDTVTGLVSKQITAPSAAVQILSTFPDDFQQQRGWLAQAYQKILLARDAVLDHHRVSHPGLGNHAAEMARSSFERKSHIDDMKRLVRHFTNA